jgi:ABC-2 type transport system ATP-binding protein
VTGSAGILARKPRRSLGLHCGVMAGKAKPFRTMRRPSRDRLMKESFNNTIIFDNVSKFYGEILGVNRVSLDIRAGITSLVGPNGAGKTTLMNLLAGLLRPTRGRISVLGIPTDEPQLLFRTLGYCSQFDSFPRGLTGREFIVAFLKISGFSNSQAHDFAEQALARVDLLPAADRKIGAYSKGMRQRVRLAQAIAHNPSVLILDEPLNGLDPMVRAETIALFKQLAADGLYLIISSHILHEVDMMSDQVVLLNNGYVVAEGGIQGVREEMDVEHPVQVLIRCNRPSLLASRIFRNTEVVEARVHDDRKGLFVKIRNQDEFYLSLNEVVATGEIEVESVAPVDDDLSAVYEYLIGAQ